MKSVRLPMFVPSSKCPNSRQNPVNTVISHVLVHITLTPFVGRQEGHPACKKTNWWGAGMVICLERGADLHMAQLMPLPLTVSCFSKIQIGFTFWYQLTRVVLEKWLLNGCRPMYVCTSTHQMYRQQDTACAKHTYKVLHKGSI